jgi:hypothetical protein
MNASMNIAQSKAGSSRLVLPAVMPGTVTRIGYYRDSLPKLVITVKKSDSTALPFRDGERVPMPFIINGECYTAGIRSTNRSATVMISPDLNDADCNPVRLTDLLYNLGWVGKQSRIELSVQDGVINFS